MPVPGIALIPAGPTPLHIRTDPHSGRKYHASTTLPANTDLLGSCKPYSYTIWKRFRNEVCAECWRYDGGRRTFLTLRDDEGLGGRPSNGDAHDHQRSSTTAGLWFCHARCQGEWVAREGVEAVDLLRQLEAARKKAQPKPKSDAGEQEVEITQEVAERAWNAVRDKERSPKEVRKWRTLQLEDYEMDMARYVLLALYRRHHEQYRNRSTSPRKDGTGLQSGGPTDSDDESSEWQTFASLQANELQLLKACPQILKHQTRIYQLLKGLFGPGAAQRSNVSSRSSSVSVGTQPGADNARTRESNSNGNESERERSEPHLADLITIANVRTILGVDPGNAFGIWEVPLMEESECLGFALYPVPSFFNHHCAANVRKERDGRGLRFVTTRAVGPGEELCISYGHVEAMDWAARQKELLEGWYFQCRCSRCTAEVTSGAR